MRNGGSKFDIIYRVMKLYHNRKSDILDFDSISILVNGSEGMFEGASYVTATCKSNFLCSFCFFLDQKCFLQEILSDRNSLENFQRITLEKFVEKKLS